MLKKVGWLLAMILVFSVATVSTVSATGRPINMDDRVEGGK